MAASNEDWSSSLSADRVAYVIFMRGVVAIGAIGLLSGTGARAWREGEARDGHYAQAYRMVVEPI